MRFTRPRFIFNFAEIIVLCLTLFSSYGAEPIGGLITNAAGILQLAPDEALKKIPVQFRGVITFSSPEMNLWYIHDGNAGVYFYPTRSDSLNEIGDAVELRGVSEKGLYSPFVYSASLKRLSRGTIPKPEPVSIEEILSGAFDCQWVQVEGVVRKVKLDQDFLTLELAQGRKKISVYSPDYRSKADESLIDSRIRIDAVVGTDFASNGILKGFKLYLPGFSNLSVLAPAKKMESLPVRSTAQLFNYVMPQERDHRLRVRGVITLAWPEGFLFLKDDKGTVRLKANNPADFVPGDLVDVIGFPSEDARGPFLEHVVGQIVKKTGLPPVIPSDLDSLASSNNGQIVRVEGKCVSMQEGEDGSLQILLKGQGNILHVITSPEMKIPGEIVGHVINATGLFISAQKGSNPELWLRSEREFVIKKTAQTAGGSSDKTILWIVLLLLTSAFLIGFFWIRQQRLSTRLADLSESKNVAIGTPQVFNSNEHPLREIGFPIEERERLARDLHDGVIQSLYAIGLNMEDCKSIVNQKPEVVEGRLQSILTDLNGVIREVRNFIAGLGSEPLKPNEFKVALKSLVLTLGDAQSSKFLMELDGTAADLLSSAQATQLLHVAREAMSNSLRHSEAQRIVISLHRTGEDTVRFEVSDDGKGFDAENISPGCWGLKNISARAREIGAKLSIISHTGRGTRLIMDLVRTNPSFTRHNKTASVS